MNEELLRIEQPEGDIPVRRRITNSQAFVEIREMSVPQCTHLVCEFRTREGERTRPKKESARDVSKREDQLFVSCEQVTAF